MRIEPSAEKLNYFMQISPPSWGCFELSKFPYIFFIYSGQLLQYGFLSGSLGHILGT